MAMFPPASAARSTTTEPGFMLSIISCSSRQLKMQIACRSEEPGKKGHHEDLGSGLPSFPAKKIKNEHSWEAKQF